jgi:hypothetical protein
LIFDIYCGGKYVHIRKTGKCLFTLNYTYLP